MKFEVPQRQQLASERTSLTLFAPAPSTISFVPLTRNLSLADPSPSEGGQASQMQLPPASKYPSIAQRAPCSNRQTGQRVSVREIRYRKQPPMVRNTHSVLKKASYGTRRIFGSIRCKKQASTVRKRYSVQKTGSCGTEWVFKGTRCAEQAHMVRLASRNDPSGEGTQNGTQKAVRNSLQKATQNGTQNGTREATQNAIFICEIKDLI